MITITEAITFDEREISEGFFCAASGPGGQNVNKVATAVLLRFDVHRSRSLPEPVKRRLARLAGSRMTSEGELLIRAYRHRTLERNRQDARERLLTLIRRAATPEKRRLPTRPTLASKQRRLTTKTKRAAVKTGRGRPPLED